MEPLNLSPFRRHDNVGGDTLDIVEIRQLRLLIRIDFDGYIARGQCANELWLVEHIAFNLFAGRAIVAPKMKQNETVLAFCHLASLTQIGDPRDSVLCDHRNRERDEKCRKGNSM